MQLKFIKLHDWNILNLTSNTCMYVCVCMGTFRIPCNCACVCTYVCNYVFVLYVWQGRRNRSGRPGNCRTKVTETHNSKILTVY